MNSQKKLTALYISSLVPSPGENSYAFTVQRINAIQNAGVNIVTVCSVNKTPPKELLHNFKRSSNWIRNKSSIPERNDGNGININYLKRFQLPQPIFGWYSYAFLYKQMFHELETLVNQFKPDVILSSWLPSSVVAGLLGKHFDIPTISIAEGSDVNIYPKQYRGWPYARNLLNNATAQVFVSRALKDQAIQVGLNGKFMEVVYNGVDTLTFSPEKKLGPPNTKKILCVSRMQAVKGIRFLIDAFAIIAENRDKSVQLTIVGDGPLKDELSDQVKKYGLSELVRFINPMPQKELVPLYQQADVLCLPSLQESFGCVLVEAMACGTPVVASRVGGIVEIVDTETGMLVPPGDPDALAKALLEALERQWNQERIRSKVVENFSWDRVGDNYLRLITWATNH